MSYRPNIPKTTAKSNVDENDVHTMLQETKRTDEQSNWSKLVRSVKMQKLTAFAEVYSAENGLDDAQRDKLIDFFRDCLDKNKLQKVKDVNYDRETASIVSIPFLLREGERYTLKNTESKHSSTLKHLTPTNRKERHDTTQKNRSGAVEGTK